MIPNVWTKGVFNPIPKSRDSNPRTPLNYRGISLLPVTSKLYTAAIAKRISKHFEKTNKLSNVQNGFREKRSCLDHIYTPNNVCKIRKNLCQDAFLSFICFQKAFGYVPHELLYHKLLNVEVDGDVYWSIKNIYHSPVSCVQLNGQLTDWFEVTSGVRQGDSLSPILFASCINGMSDEVVSINAGVFIGGNQLHMLLYADDIVLIAHP